MRATLVHNPKAGRGDSDPEALRAALAEVGIDAAYLSTREEGFADALKEPGDLVLVAGGDGTVQKVAPRLVGRPVPLAILPLGSANNIARSLGMPATPEQVIAGLPAAPRRRFDIWCARGPWGERLLVEGLGIGGLARSSEADGPSPEHKEKRGRAALAETLASAVPLAATVLLDGVPLPGGLLWLEATNIAYAGPRLQLAAIARPDDACLDLFYMPESYRQQALAWLAAGAVGPAPGLVRRGARVVVSVSGAPLRLDDDPLPPPDGRVEIELAHHGQVEILVPAHSLSAPS